MKQLALLLYLLYISMLVFDFFLQRISNIHIRNIIIKIYIQIVPLVILFGWHSLHFLCIILFFLFIAFTIMALSIYVVQLNPFLSILFIQILCLILLQVSLCVNLIFLQLRVLLYLFDNSFSKLKLTWTRTNNC